MTGWPIAFSPRPIDRQAHRPQRSADQLADVADTLSRLAPGMEALEPAIATLQDAVMSLTLVVDPLSNIAGRIPLPGAARHGVRRRGRCVPSASSTTTSEPLGSDCAALRRAVSARIVAPLG